jgi:hypothetical protein
MSLDIGDLTSKARQFRDTVDEAIESNSELAEYVEQLENEVGEEDEVQGDRLVEEIEDFLKER